MRKGSYEIADRLDWWKKKQVVTVREYQKVWERSRSAFFRDMEHLSLFYNINFKYDKVSHVHRRIYG